jgi:hypothetical protein
LGGIQELFKTKPDGQAPVEVPSNPNQSPPNLV